MSVSVPGVRRPCTLLQARPEIPKRGAQRALHSQKQRRKLPLLTAPSRLASQKSAHYNK
jgi:hypothetical protein